MAVRKTKKPRAGAGRIENTFDPGTARGAKAMTSHPSMAEQSIDSASSVVNPVGRSACARFPKQAEDTWGSRGGQEGVSSYES
jgi:hypothetical protein